MVDSEYKQFLQAYGYILGERIGKGSFGVVFRCTRLSGNGNLETFAVKIVDIRRLKMESRKNLDVKIKRLEREISIMQKLDHDHIVKLHDVYRTKEAFFLIMELVIGIDLFEMIVAENGLKKKKSESFDESLGEEVFVQIVDCIAYLHSLNIIHRDIKPENLILKANSTSSESNNSNAMMMTVKLIDFGLSKVIGDSDIMDDPNNSNNNNLGIGLTPSKAKSLVGTPKYIAPEILQNMSIKNHHQHRKSMVAYDTKVDCYSMGVLLHVILGACFPQFVDVEEPDNGLSANSADRDSMRLLARNGKSSVKSQIVFQDDRIKHISEEAKSLIVNLLQVDPSKRMTMKEVLTHPWILMNTRRGTKRHTNDNDDNEHKHSKNKNNDTNQEKVKENPDLKLRKLRTNDSVKHLAIEAALDKMDTDDSIESIKLSSFAPELVAAFDDHDQDFGPSALSDQALLMLNKSSNNGKALEDPQMILSLQAKIATYLKEAYDKFLGDESIAPHVVASACGSRELLRVTAQLLSKLEQTAASTIGLLPDLQLAVEEQEFELASNMFCTIKDWIDELKGGATGLMDKNAAVIKGVNCAIAAIKAKKPPEQLLDAKASLAVTRNSQHVLRKVNEAIKAGHQMTVDQMTQMFSSTQLLANNGIGSPIHDDAENVQEESLPRAKPEVDVETLQLVEALQALQQVDRLLQRHASFWSQMEVLIQILQQRAHHVNSITKFTRNPKLRGRFIQRLEEYSMTWDNVRLLCQRFNHRAQAITPALYAFLSE